MYNGLNVGGARLGDGNGFKAGGYGTSPADRLPNPVPRHVVSGCVAMGNKANGFYANHHISGDDWFNNSAFRNGSNFNFLGRLADNRTDVPGGGHRIRNNLSYRSRALVTHFEAAKNEADHNSFAPEMKLSDADFTSLDETQLTAPRQPGGELPIITVLHPAEGSSLIGGGVDVVSPHGGSRPDIGAFGR
jgi:hypothetical protein